MPSQRLPRHGGDAGDLVPQSVDSALRLDHVSIRVDPLRYGSELRLGVVMPLRSFEHGKARLAGVLDADARAALGRDMAEVVVKAAGGLPLVIVSSGPDVTAWAAALGLECIDDPGTLDGAAEAGRAWVRSRELERVAIVHADLPLARTLDAVVDARGPDGDLQRLAVLVPDHRGDGTPVLVLPVAAPFHFAYGPGSFARHLAEAAHCDLHARVVRDPTLGFDIDLPEDLERLAATEGA